MEINSNKNGTEDLIVFNFIHLFNHYFTGWSSSSCSQFLSSSWFTTGPRREFSQRRKRTSKKGLSSSLMTSKRTRGALLGIYPRTQWNATVNGSASTTTPFIIVFILIQAFPMTFGPLKRTLSAAYIVDRNHIQNVLKLQFVPANYTQQLNALHKDIKK